MMTARPDLDKSPIEAILAHLKNVKQSGAGSMSGS